MTEGRKAISARVVANLLECQGAGRVIFVDIRNLATQGFFNIPVDPLTAISVLADYFRKPEFQNSVIVSPDVGRASMAAKYAEYLNLPLVIMPKGRTSFRETKVTHIIGEIVGRRPIIIDDLIASGSILNQIDVLYQEDAEGRAYFAIIHPILLPNTLKLLSYRKAHRHKYHPPSIQKINLQNRSVIHCPLLADIIQKVHRGESISDRLVLS